MLKTAINYILWRLGLRKILPKKIVSRVVVTGSSESVVEVLETTRLKISKSCPQAPTLRFSVAGLLEKSARNLPEGYSLVLFEGFRPLSRQQFLWDNQYEKIKKENPGLPQGELERRTRIFVAKPDASSGGHQTGAAVDVTLGNQNGEELFLGTKMHEFSPATATDAKNISDEAKKLRAILLTAMRSAGFVNYPGEWWHFSYGDKLWAAYSRRKECRFGPV